MSVGDTLLNTIFSGPDIRDEIRKLVNPIYTDASTALVSTNLTSFVDYPGPVSIAPVVEADDEVLLLLQVSYSTTPIASVNWRITRNAAIFADIPQATTFSSASGVSHSATYVLTDQAPPTGSPIYKLQWAAPGGGATAYSNLAKITAIIIKAD